MAEVKQNSFRKTLINGFILLHLYIIVAWGLPGSNFRFFLIKPISKYVIYSGLWHSWDMFSPDPLAINFRVEAEVKYQNGALKTWAFPQMDKLGIWSRFQKERYRKWGERVRMDLYSVAWDDTARYVARLNDTPMNHPIEVTLVRRWAPIPIPSNIPGRSKFSDYQPMIGPDPAFVFNYHYKIYTVQPGDL